MEKETGNVRRYGINQTENALALAGSIGGKSGLKPPAGTLSAEGIIPRFTDFLEDELDSLGSRLTDTVSETQMERMKGKVLDMRLSACRMAMISRRYPKIWDMPLWPSLWMCTDTLRKRCGKTPQTGCRLTSKACDFLFLGLHSQLKHSAYSDFSGNHAGEVLLSRETFFFILLKTVL